MDIQESYDEWKFLVKESRRIVERKRELRQALKTLTSKEKVNKTLKHRKSRNQERDVIIVLLYKEGKTLQEISDIYGIVRERVRQILRWEGITRKDGGSFLNIKRKRSSPCKVDGCDRTANGSRGYCKTHYSRIMNYGTPTIKYKNEFQEHEDYCLVEGCDEPFRANGLCNKHFTNFYFQRREGNIKDLDDYIAVQQAKRKIGKQRIRFSEIREFMKSQQSN